MSYPNDSRPPDQQPPYPPHNPPHHDSVEQHGPWEAEPEVQRERHRLAQENARHTRAQRLTGLDILVRGVIYLVVALEVLLGLRFLLRLTAANPNNMFAGFIYNLSRPFVSPFSDLFISPTFSGNENIFDVNVVVAMAAYLALLALFLGLVRVFSDR